KIMNFVSLIDKRDYDVSFYDKVLDSLESVFHYHNTAFFVKDKSITTPVATKINSNIIDEYKNYFYKKDIFVEDASYGQSILTVKDVMPLNKYKNTEYYNDFLKKHNFYYAVSIPLTIGSDLI